MNTTDSIYLDHAAATPLNSDVFAAMQPYFSDAFYNPSSPYAPAVQVRREYEHAKQRLANTIGATGDELVMTAGATESINLAFSAVQDHVVTSAVEHVAVLEAARRHDATLVTSDTFGRISPDNVMNAVTPETTLVSVGLANSELGTVQPIREIAIAIDAIRRQRLEAGNATPLSFHCDASQGFGLIDIHVARLGVDMLTLNAGKIYGPKQTGLLWLNLHTSVTPQIVGGGQERGLRSGTENVASTVGFALAAELAIGGRESEVRRLTKLRDYLETTIVAAIPGAVMSGHKKYRLPSHVHLSFPGIDAERLVFMLEKKGVFVATGSACAANKHSASHVLTAIGASEAVIAGSLRMTLGKLTNEKNIQHATRLIIETVIAEYDRVGQR